MTVWSHGRTDLDPIWKALADPSRRRILDLLRDGPRTTWDLCASFESSRFAVMKHLRVLEHARLILVRRRGRERWNTSIRSIQSIYERWLTPYAALWAGELLDLGGAQSNAGRTNRKRGKMTPGPKLEHVFEIQIKGSIKAVWDEITKRGAVQQPLMDTVLATDLKPGSPFRYSRRMESTRSCTGRSSKSIPLADSCTPISSTCITTLLHA